MSPASPKYPTTESGGVPVDVLVTAALPYANGSIHIGHLVEYLQADIYVRALNMAGSRAIYICADDTHGTPIEISAQKAGVTPEEFVKRFEKEHLEDFHAFGIHFDSFYSTNSEENRKWVHTIYRALQKGNHIKKKTLEQLYDEKAGRFLPDRFVKGTCPKCNSKDQYGDVCEKCGATYQPTDLIEPTSVLTSTKPVLRQSEHLFVDLTRFANMLEDFTNTEGRLQPEVRNFVHSWLKEGLKDWCISRDAPYFGFEIPDLPGKFFYVWLDAPIGYISSTENWAKQSGQPGLVEQIWRNKNTKVVHIIGRDITYFHTLFWPAMLHAADLKIPDRVQIHGMLTVNGEKMSKSRGTFINAKTFREHLDPEYLRYYFASKIGPTTQDVDLSAEEFVNRVNAELVNNLANLVSRGAAFLESKLDGRFGVLEDKDQEHVEFAKLQLNNAKAAYQEFSHGEAVRCAIQISNRGNLLFQEEAPWSLIKHNKERARNVVTLGLNLARAAAVAVAPAIPKFSEKVYGVLGLANAPKSFDEGLRFDLQNRPMGKTNRLVERIQPEAFQAVVEASKSSLAEPTNTSSTSATEHVAIETFLQTKLKVGLITEASFVEGADKLLRLAVDLGEPKPRTIFAGIRSAYEPGQLVGKKVVVVANLAPRKMKFGISEGMILAAGPGGKDIWLLAVPDGAPIGSEIR